LPPPWLVWLPVLGPAMVASHIARAQPPSPELMAKLAAASEGFDEIRKRASYSVEHRLETIDREGHVVGVEAADLRMERDGVHPRVVVLRATKDGKDWTEQARNRAREDEAKAASDPKKGRLDIPFLASEQPRYVFDVVETDAAHSERVRIAFMPKEADAHTVEGSAWVDAAAGRFLSAGIKVSRPGLFVDYIHVTLEVGATTALGPALSRITFEGEGGFLLLHKHFRGSEVFSDYRVTQP